MKRRRSSQVRREQLEKIDQRLCEDQPPLLAETPAAEREELLRQKLDLCTVVFDFGNASEQTWKEIKRKALLELVDFIRDEDGEKMLIEATPLIVHAVSANIFRALPPVPEEVDPQEDDPVLQASWPHLQVVYELLLRFVASPELKAKEAKQHLNTTFCQNLVGLFESEDPRERDYLKEILLRIYGKV